ncbi:MAG: TetR/AcrR family transcriptional regulator [Desulfobacterales bacterium]|nr:TetR/AcrR family transcriptional regulator [Desulfobacterales bacterium]MBL7102279.1 TetR/AcrR family transcriptional regulator [Desulfobacteraceae bacterium]
MSRAAGSKDRIIDVAIDLFSKRGFKGTSIRDIASAAEISIPNIYHYFGNKEGLLLAILQRSSEDVLRQLKRVCQLEIEPLERFKRLVATHISVAGNSIKEAKIFFLDDEDLSKEGNKINLQIQREILGIYLDQLHLLQEKNLVHYKSHTVLAFNILALVNWFLRWYRLKGPMSLEEITEEIVTFSMYGLLGPASRDEEPMHA